MTNGEKLKQYTPYTIITVVIVFLFQLVEQLLPDEGDKILEAIRMSDQNSAKRHERLYDKLSNVHTDVLLQRRVQSLDVPPAGMDYNAWLALQPYAGAQP